MNYIYIFLAIIAIALIGFNATFIDFTYPFSGESLIAVFGICACLCALTLLAILYVSRKIVEKTHRK